MEIKSKLDSVMGRWVAEHNRSLSIPELADLMGDDVITRDFLYRFRRNDMMLIDLKRLAALCQFFDCQPGDLLEAVPKPPPDA